MRTAKALSTEMYRRGRRTALELGHGPLDSEMGACCLAFGTLHAALDPVVGIDAGRWVHALGGKAHDIDDLRLILLFVEAVGAVSRFRDALVSIADGKLNRARWPLKLNASERSCKLVRGRLRSARLGLLIGEFQAKER